jgi:hypothetical protein
MQNFVNSVVFRNCFSCQYLYAALSKLEDVRYGECLSWVPENGGNNIIYNVFTSACDDYVEKIQE